MERTPKRLKRDFKFVRIHLEDYYRIIEILNADCESVTVHISDFKLSDPKEIESIGPKVITDYCSIWSTNPRVGINLEKASCYITTYDDDTRAVGLFKRIEGILDSSQLKYLHPIAFCGEYFLGPIFIGVSFLIILSSLGTVVRIVDSIALVVCTFLLMRIVILNGGNFKFFIERKHEKRSFFVRKKDEIIIVLVGAIAGFLLTVLGAWTYDKFFK